MGTDPHVWERGTLEAPSGYLRLVCVGMGPFGPLAVWCAGGTAHAIVAYDDFACAVETVVVELPWEPTFVQPFPGSGYLVVDARCQWRESGPERNAAVVGPDGVIVSRGCLGDGIQHLLADGDGTIWAGYSDEGVLGSHGWAGPGPRPLGCTGIVRWSRDFEPLWEFPYAGQIVDCYALNVADEVWACTYTGFPLIQITAPRVRTFSTPFDGPVGVVVAGRRVAAIGRYGVTSALTVGELVGDEVRTTFTGGLRLPDGRPLPPSSVHCRGSRAHFFAEDVWLEFDVNDVATM